jgi:hypothetical protein
MYATHSRTDWSSATICWNHCTLPTKVLGRLSYLLYILEALFGYWVVKLSSIDTPHKKSIVEVGYSMSGLLEGIRVPNILGFPAISKQQIFHSKSESCGEYGKIDIVVLKSSSSEG